MRDNDEAEERRRGSCRERMVERAERCKYQVCLDISDSTYICIHVGVCVSIYVCILVDVCVSICIYVCIHVGVCVSIYIYLYVYMWMFVLVYVYKLMNSS